MTVAEPVSVETPHGVVSGLWLDPPGADLGYVLAHGAGAGMTHSFMAAIAGAFAEAGVATLRYQFPYMEARSGRPDSPAVATAAVRAATVVAERLAGGRPLFAGGKSFGGRMTSTAQAESPLCEVRGIVFLGFPLHPAKRPATSRAQHLRDVRVPMLFLQGTRDELAEIDLIRGVVAELPETASLHEVDGADHAFAVLKRTGRTNQEIIVELVRVASDWMRSVAGGAAKLPS